MKAGAFADLIRFQRRGSVPDGYGNEQSGPWADIEIEGAPLEVWADMLERTGKERMDGGALDAPRMATIRVPRFPETEAILESDRIVARGESWNIRSIVAVQRNRAVIEFEAETGVAT